MLRQAISILTIRVAGILVAFAFLSFVSRLLSPAALGTFLFAVTTVTLLHIVVICGAITKLFGSVHRFGGQKNCMSFEGLLVKEHVSSR